VFNKTGTGGVSPTGIAREACTAALLVAVVAAGSLWPGLPVSAGESESAPAATYTAPLDGRTFSARIVRSGDTGNLGDEMVFNNGMFSSAVCRTFNFAEAPYWVRLEGDQVHFLAELTSPTDGRMLWKGTIRGDTLEGTMRWTKERWYWIIDTEHKIRGASKKPSAAP